MNVTKAFARFIGKKKKVLLIILSIFIVVGLAIIVVIQTSTKNPEVKVESYKNIEDAIKSQIEPKRLESLEAYDQALKLYRDEDYSGAAKALEAKLKEGNNDSDIQPSYYALIYNCYLKLSQLENAKNTVIEYQKTESYSNLADETKKSWIDTLTALNKGEVPSDSSGSESDE